MTRISVAMTTCNGARYVAEQLQSIRAQTRLPDELVICDDRSDDQTLDIVKAVVADAPFWVEVVSNPERLGVTANVEQAICRTTGDVVVLADQDDIWRPHKLARLEEHFAARPHTSAVFSDGDIIDGASRPTGRRLWSSTGFVGRRRKSWTADPMGVLLQGNVVTGAALAFRAALKPLILPIPVAGWHDQWITILVAATGWIDALDDPLIRYRVHGKNLAGVAADVRTELHRRLTQSGQRMEALEQMNKLILRLEERGFGSQPAVAGLQAKVCHLTFRRSLPQAFLPRSRAIVRAAGRGMYHRYSAGRWSVMFDIAYGGRRGLA